jgi:hypothetical protein
MYAGADYTETNPSESEFYSLDFTATVGGTNPITDVTFTLTPVSGSDPSAASRISGGTFNGYIATCLLTSLVSGVKYRVQCDAGLTSGETKTLYSFVNCVALGV